MEASSFYKFGQYTTGLERRDMDRNRKKHFYKRYWNMMPIPNAIAATEAPKTAPNPSQVDACGVNLLAAFDVFAAPVDPVLVDSAVLVAADWRSDW